MLLVLKVVNYFYKKMKKYKLLIYNKLLICKNIQKKKIFKMH